MARDLKQALRRLLKRPAFFVAAALTLTLGIGFSTVVFQLVNFLLLRPLPVDDPGTLFTLTSRRNPVISFPNYLDIREETRDVFTEVAALRVMPMHVNSSGENARLWGYLVTGNYFELLGIEPFLGRLLTPSDDMTNGAHAVAVLSHGAWQRRFGADPGLVGSAIRANGHTFEVVGIAPPGFIGTERVLDAEIWIPFSMIREIEGRDWRVHRRTHNAWAIARLRPELSRESAEASLALVASRLARDHPEENEGLELHLAPAGLLGNLLRGPVVEVGGALLLVSTLTLLVACANLSNLLLAQAADRRKEFALRLSLGASRSALARMVLAETLVLALAGGAAGLLISDWLARALVASLPMADFPLNAGFTTDARVSAFAFAVALLAALLSSLWPALRSSRIDPLPAIKSEAPFDRARRLDLRDLYVGIQVLSSIVLLSGSLTTIRTLKDALAASYGFAPSGAVALRFDLGMHGYDQERGREFQRRLLDEVRSLPGVEAAGLSNSIPFSIDQSFSTIYVEGKPVPPISEAPSSVVYQATPDLLRAMGTRFIAGRDFGAGDDTDSPAVAIVNETVASKLLPGEDPIGKRIRFNPAGDPIEIVGVVEAGKYQTINEEPQFATWRPLAQIHNNTSTLVARTGLPAEAALSMLRRSVVEIDPEITVFDAKPLAGYLDVPTTPLRLTTAALTAMGALAVVLSALGLHALVAFTTSRRTREIGIRVALGASSVDVLRSVTNRTLAVVGASAAVGLVLSFIAVRALASVLFAAPEASIHFLAASVMVAVSVVSCIIPARRALRLEPLKALRYE
jgi:predicted permease